MTLVINFPIPLFDAYNSSPRGSACENLVIKLQFSWGGPWSYCDTATISGTGQTVNLITSSILCPFKVRKFSGARGKFQTMRERFAGALLICDTPKQLSSGASFGIMVMMTLARAHLRKTRRLDNFPLALPHAPGGVSSPCTIRRGKG